MGAEDDLREICTRVLKEWRHDRGLDQINIASDDGDNTGTDLLSDFTFVPEESGLRLYLGSQTADIVLFASAHDFTDVLDSHDALTTSHGASSEDIKIPLAVIELKRGSATTGTPSSGSPSTDAIRARSRVARDVKRVFPFAGYFLYVDRSTVGKQKLYRAGRDFDAAFITEKTATPDLITESIIEHGVEPHLERLEYLDIL